MFSITLFYVFIANMGDPGGIIGTLVRNYLHYNNLASSFYKQFGAARKVRDDYENQVISTLQRNGMEKATIQIGGGNIHVVDKREPNPLSLSKIEELLHGYFRHKGGKDETLDIMTFLRANRGYTMVKSLKHSNLVQNQRQLT
jgi:hypothetical protein